MELKTARLTLLIDPNKKAAFERLCAQRDLTASQVVRQMIRDYLAEHGVSYEPSGGLAADPDGPAAEPDALPRKAPPVRPRASTAKGKAKAQPGAATTKARRKV